MQDEDRLSLARVRLLGENRRAVLRRRRLFIVTAALAFALTARLLITVVNDFGIGSLLACLAAVAVLAWAVGRLLDRPAIEAIPEPETTPDFATLSDGSRRHEALERIE